MFDRQSLSYNRNGVYKTLDGGFSWSKINDNPYIIYSVMINYSQLNIQYIYYFGQYYNVNKMKI